MVDRSALEHARAAERNGAHAEQIDHAAALLAANRSDQGNAECLALLHGDQLRYCHTRRRWLTWKGGLWQVDETGEAQRMAVATARARYRAAEGIEDLDARKKFASWCISAENTRAISNMLEAAHRVEEMATTISDYDTDPMLVNAGPRTINLHTGEPRQPRRSDMLSMRLGADYDATADCPRWQQFLREIFADDGELIAFIQRAVGYTLTGLTREQKLFICFGGGANGKSVFLGTLAMLLGDYAQATSFDTFDAEKRSTIGNELAVLKGKRLVTVIESDEDRRLSEARIKSVTGGDAIACRFLYGETFNYRPTWKLWLAMNHKPAIRGTDAAIWRRILPIMFRQSFVGREDRTLEAQLRAELPGILNWALAGLRAWQSQGLMPPASVIDALAEYRKESDTLGQWLAECTEDGKAYEVKASDLYASYKGWTFAAGHKPYSLSAWSRQMADRGYAKDMRRNVTFYAGIGIVTA